MVKFSIIIPVYNRPEEVEELLVSLSDQSIDCFEVIIIDDGSTKKSEEKAHLFKERLDIQYFFKPNEGPGPTRNFGVSKAKGKWIVFLDSDCFVPSNYIEVLDNHINSSDIDVFGGPDKDHESFSSIQKAISFSMTSFLTTGGIRGSKNSMEKFKPRSFNMGMKKSVFEAIGGFVRLRFGEDMDLSIRLAAEGRNAELIKAAYVFHKRRTNFRQFHKQVFNSGVARIVLGKLHPGTINVVHLFPAIFLIGNIGLMILGFLRIEFFAILLFYPLLLLITSFSKFRNFRDSFNSVIAAYVQLSSYAMGFLKAAFTQFILRKPIKHAYLDSFYD